MTLTSAARAVWLWGPPVGYLGVIFYLSAQPQVAWAASYPDYLLHAIEYAGLSILVARALNGGIVRPIPARRLRWAWIFCVAYAVSDEAHQYFVPGRSSDVRDVLADAAGAALALAAFSAAQRALLRGGLA